jgi:uncharacterized protein (DUF305 family)
MKRPILCLLVPIALLFSAPSYAAHNETGIAAEQTEAGKQELKTSMEEMDRAMMQADDPVFSRAFVLKMIEHHKGAIEMSRILLKYGKDAELRGMAEKGMKMQEKEIGEMQEWLKSHGGNPRS